MKYLLDTNALTAWVTKDAVFVQHIQTTNPSDLAISVMTEHEVLFGIACNPKLRLRAVAVAIADDAGVSVAGAVPGVTGSPAAGAAHGDDGLEPLPRRLFLESSCRQWKRSGQRPALAQQQ